MFANYRFIIKSYKLLDLLAILVSFALATWITFYGEEEWFSFHEFLSMRIKVQNFLLFFGLLMGWQFIGITFRLYHLNRLSANLARESLEVIKAISTYTLLFFLTSLFFDIALMTPSFLICFWMASNMLCISCRYAVIRIFMTMHLKDRNLRFLLIVGTNARAFEFAMKIQTNSNLGYRLIGFVDESWQENGKCDELGWKLVSDFKNFTNFINRNVVDEVIITLPIQSFYQEAAQILSTCEEQGIVVRNLSDLFNLKIARTKSDYFDGLPMVSHYSGYIFGWRAASKRLIDILVSALLLVFLSPLLFIITISIKLFSHGPAFFIQDRIGLNKRLFRLYKFRTMVEDAEPKQAMLESFNELEGPAFKIKDDPRITKIGKFLRKTSLDELPQLMNVLKGDMSLVGPRPLPVRDYNGFKLDWHRRRFCVLPGITCLWQVNGRNDIPFDRWMELDLQYIDQWNLLLDLRILLKTIPAVLKKSGAS
jgi:exopolysaccharide biosynthesis polyprenyl glycosylphosphotransferase